MRVVAFLGRVRLGPALLLAVLAAAAPSLARAEDDPALQAWKRLDRDGKGYITFDEFVRASDERLRRMDKNGDGAIGKDEFIAYHEAEAQRRADRIFAALDPKRTGRIAAADLKDPEAQRLLACDLDKDGFITRAEYLECRRRVAERWMQRIFARYDKNGDGVIARDERVAALREVFQRLDADGDGRITRDEFFAARKRAEDRRGATGNRPSAPSSDPDDLE